MNGHVIKRAGYWRISLELGEQAALRCPTCVDRSGKGRRYWSNDDPPDTCPRCGGELEEILARRQELLPAPHKYTRKKEAEKALHDELRDRERGNYVPPSDLTVREYLEDRWIPALAGEELAAGSVRLYRTHVEQRIVPVLGALELQKLTTSDVVRLKTHMATTKGVRGKLPSAQTRRQTLIVLHKALEAAIRDGLVRRNVAQGVKPPRVHRREMLTWSAEELHAFLESTRSDRLYPLWRFIAQTGLRRGEALGLMLDALDLDCNKVMVRRQRKQDGYDVKEGPLKAGDRRSISMDNGTVEALRAQLQQQLDDADEWGDAWTATGHVFTREDGSPWHPDRVSKLFDQAVKAADLPRIRLHDLRHTWATLALRAGVHPKVVQERLGHKRIAITLDTYSHVLPDMQQSAAELVASLVDGVEE